MIDADTSGQARRRMGIGLRLSLAFALVVGLSSIACLTGLAIYEKLARDMQEIAGREIPRLSSATQLARLGSDVSAKVSLLSQTEGSAGFDRLRQDTEGRLRELANVIASSSAWSDEPSLRRSVGNLEESLRRLSALAEERFARVEQLTAKVDELRWLQSDLIAEVEPLIDDARYNIERDLGASAPKGNVLRETSRSEALLTALAQANLAIGLLTRFSEVSNKDDADDAFAFLDDSTDDLRVSQKTLSSWPDSITLRQLAGQIIALSDRISGIPALKLSELDARSRMNAMLVDAQGIVERLGDYIGQEVAASERNSSEVSRRVETFLGIGRALLLTIVGLSIAGAFAVGYFYVHRHLVVGLRRLADEATGASNDTQGQALVMKRDDELGDLAKALHRYRQTRDELVQAAKLAALGQMVTGLAHELNQPLAAMRSYAFNGLRQLDAGRNKDARSTFSKVSGLVDGMAERIGQMRRFSRLPDAELVAASVPVAIDDALGLLRHRFVEEEIRLLYEAPDDDLWVSAQPVRLEQVLVNLISNAIDSLPEHGAREIQIDARTEEAAVEIRVSDTGTGISPDFAAKIFDPFFTTKEPGDGLGLGLSIAFNIMRDFGGRLVLESTGPKGSTFLMQLPGAAHD